MECILINIMDEIGVVGGIRKGRTKIMSSLMHLSTPVF